MINGRMVFDNLFSFAAFNLFKRARTLSLIRFKERVCRLVTEKDPPVTPSKGV